MFQIGHTAYTFFLIILTKKKRGYIVFVNENRNVLKIEAEPPKMLFKFYIVLYPVP